MANYSLSDEERRLINSVLKFANLKEVKSVDQIHSIFDRYIIQRLPVGQEEAFRSDQRKLRSWLDTLITKRRLTNAIQKEIGDILNRAVSVQFGLLDGCVGVTSFLLPGVESCLSYAAALLVDRNRNLTPFLRRCAAPKCGRYFLAKKGRGQQGNWCKPSHKAEAQRAQNLKRVKSYWERLK